jgi:hypothetical protein
VVITRLTPRSGAVQHDTRGELDVKRVNKEMENQPAEINMMILFERMLQEQRAQSEAASAVERIVKRNGEFNGKDVSRYLRNYKAQMLRWGISRTLYHLIISEFINLRDHHRIIITLSK